MLDKYLEREEVKKLISEFQKNPKCLRKNAHTESLYGQRIRDELALYLFYDTIFKYKVLIDDEQLFPEFFTQVEKLFRKIESCDDLSLGVIRLLINFAAMKLDARNTELKENREKIIRHFYQKYIVDGYLIHGYSTSYKEFIKGRNFIPEQYPNHYQRMIKIQQIFDKHKLPGLNKNFDEKKCYFTDDFVMACYYSVMSPGYFYQLLVNKDKDNIAYLKRDYNALSSSLKRFMINNSFNKSECKLITKSVGDEWKFLNRVPKKVSLILIKRNKVLVVNDNKLNEYLDSDKDLEEIIERILSPKNNNVSVSRVIKYGEYQLIDLNDFYEQEEKNEVVEDTKPVKKIVLPYELINTYGVASILLIFGSLLITLGVIFSIIMVLRGMS